MPNYRGVIRVRCKFEVGNFVLVNGKAGKIDDYDKEDNTYRVSFDDVNFGWYEEGEIQS